MCRLQRACVLQFCMQGPGEIMTREGSWDGVLERSIWRY